MIVEKDQSETGRMGAVSYIQNLLQEHASPDYIIIQAQTTLSQLTMLVCACICV